MLREMKQRHARSPRNSDKNGTRRQATAEFRRGRDRARRLKSASFEQKPRFPPEVEDVAFRVGPPLPGAAQTRIRDHFDSPGEFRSAQPKVLAQQALEAVAPDGVADLRAHGEPQTGLPFGGVDAMPKDERASDGLLSGLEDPTELSSLLEASVVAETRGRRQAFFLIKTVRPLARRRLSVLRPPGVAIRARKPIFFMRLRLCGLYVGSIEGPL